MHTYIFLLKCTHRLLDPRHCVVEHKHTIAIIFSGLLAAPLCTFRLWAGHRVKSNGACEIWKRWQPRQKIFFFRKRWDSAHTISHAVVCAAGEIYAFIQVEPSLAGRRGWGWRTVPSMKLTISETYQSHHNATSHTCEASGFQVKSRCKAVAQGESKEYYTVEDCEWTWCR